MLLEDWTVTRPTQAELGECEGLSRGDLRV